MKTIEAIRLSGNQPNRYSGVTLRNKTWAVIRDRYMYSTTPNICDAVRERTIFTDLFQTYRDIKV